jgi:hypothetical protein
MTRKIRPQTPDPVLVILDERWYEGAWDHSEFPHPLVTLDYDKDGNLLAVSTVKSKVIEIEEKCVR